ncbi:MAG: antibiotic resistance protein MarC [Gammaproteobacteria bacterium HGW-Gammaproteobacteria-3]|nr:MAG: antibiotic resistance protein MarC [Gammaproteobacteria bacterium HGW-Gammaproteobacteria-3]
MIETVSVALATLFTTVGPLDVAAVFAALTVNATASERYAYALRGITIATVLLALFALTGDFLLTSLGISIAALKTSGGVLLLLIAIDMVFARASGAVTTTSQETDEARLKRDISVFPLATPLIAGPGAMGAIILLISDAKGDMGRQALVLLALLIIMLATLLALLAAIRIQRFLGVIGIQVITRISGILLAALAVQFIFDGIVQSGIAGR